MKRSLSLLILSVILAVGTANATAQKAVPAAAQRATTAPSPGAPADEKKFDPSANPVKDVAAAVVVARKSGRRIVLDVGGEWCSWCHTLDRFLREHQDLSTAIARDFVWLKINFSPENKNEAFLKRYPAIPGYPHLFVLSPDGQLLHSQDTSLLELGPSYDLPKIQAFLAKWAKG